jgi:hypothetical protein
MVEKLEEKNDLIIDLQQQVRTLGNYYDAAKPLIEQNDARINALEDFVSEMIKTYPKRKPPWQKEYNAL